MEILPPIPQIPQKHRYLLNEGFFDKAMGDICKKFPFHRRLVAVKNFAGTIDLELEHFEIAARKVIKDILAFFNKGIFRYVGKHAVQTNVKCRETPGCKYDINY